VSRPIESTREGATRPDDVAAHYATATAERLDIGRILVGPVRGVAPTTTRIRREGHACLIVTSLRVR